MKHVKLRTIIAMALVVILLVSFAGCNYVKRPDGAKNNSTDNSSRLLSLLAKDQIIEIPPEQPQQPEEPEQPEQPEQPEEPEQPEQPEQPEEPEEPEQPPVDVTTPFNAPGDVITKIDEILASLSGTVVDATSATGVKDELMTSRTVEVYMPYTLFDKQSAAIETISSNLNMNIAVTVIPDNYVATVKKSVLAGNSADLMYVDQQAWGYTQHFTQDISNFVNFDIGDELGTFLSHFSSKFSVKTEDKSKCFAASGIGAPYLMVYDPSNIVVPDVMLPANEDEGTTELKVEDPLTMFNNDRWCVSAFTEIIKASTTNGRVGYASIIDDDRNLDLWMGMEGNDSFSINFDTLVAQVDASIMSREALETVGGNMDLLQSWYWTQLGADNSNYVAAWTEADEWENTVEKTVGDYRGADSVTSYSFFTVGLDEFAAVKDVAEVAGRNLEFVSVPYGLGTENIMRSVAPDSEGVIYDPNGVAIKPYAAGWIGGFSVLKTCENPAVALRVAEEITKAWKENCEAPVLKLMTEDQQARYAKMKENIGVSFYRSVIFNASTAYTQYGSTVTDRLAPSDVSRYQTLQLYADFNGTLTQPMYRKETSIGSYDASIFDTWSEFYYGKLDPTDRVTQLTYSILPSLSAAYLPPSILFIY